MKQTLLSLLGVLTAWSAWAQTNDLVFPALVSSPQPTTVNQRSATGSARQMAALATPVIRYVKAGASGTGASWSDASGDLQAIITASVSGDQVWIAGGTYKPSTTGLSNARDASFSLKNGVSVLGGFTGTAGTEGNVGARTAIPSSTTLSGDIGTIGDNSDNAYHVIYNNYNGLDNSAVLDGVVITRGNANDFGGGMFNLGSSPSLVSCQFIANNATNAGGGLCDGANTARAANCSFIGNSAAFGGGSYAASSSGTLVNCYFYQNTASSSGGAAAFQSTSSTNSLINCTFSGNISPRGGALGTEANVTLTNCIAWNNGEQNSFYTNGSGGYSASYSLIETGATNYTDGGHNQTLTTSPFDNATGPTLKACVPAVDAGNDAANTTTADVLSNARKVRTIDIGAAEFQGSPTQPATITSQFQSVTTICEGNAQELSLQITLGGTAPYTVALFKDNVQTAKTEVAQTGASIRFVTSLPRSGSTSLYQLVVTSSCNSVTANFAPVTVNALPIPYAVTGGGAYCSGSTAPAIGLAGSQTGVNYQLVSGGWPVGNPVAGTGNALTFGNQSIEGTYLVRATNVITNCQRAMSGTVSVTLNQPPSVSITPSALTGCAGTIITLSAQGADTYIWNTGAMTTSIPVSATGTGVYSVTGTITSSGCSATASQSITIYPLPATPTLLTQSGQSYPGGQSSVSVDVNSGNVNLVVGGCNGIIAWSGPNNTAGNSSPIVVSTDRIGRFVYTATCTSMQGCTSGPASATVTVGGRLTILHRDVDNYADNNAIQPLLQLQNQGNSALPLSRLTLRYYLTLEGNSALSNLNVNYAQVGNQNVRLRYVALQTAQQGATGYVEVSFTAGAGSLAAGSNSGPIQTYFARGDYGTLVEPNDYSYNPVRDQLTATQRITAYYEGVLIAGIEPGSAAQVRSVRALTESRNGPSATQINTVLEVRNEGTVALNYSDLRARYYFTSDGTERLQVELDEGQVSTQLVALPQPVAGANYYLEVRYNQGGQLAPGASTGAIRYRILKPNGGRFNQANDYSYQEQPAERSQNSRVVVYVGGEVVWGTPPSGANARVATSQEPGTALQVRVLGNPVRSDKVSVQITGAGGEPLQLQLVSAQGRTITQQQIAAPKAVEQHDLSLAGQGPGVFLLQVSTPTENQTVRILKVE